MKNFLRNLSIGQSFLFATMILVGAGIVLTSAVQYAFFMTGTDSMIERQSREINKQIVLNYEGYIHSVIETMNNVQAMMHNLDPRVSADRVREIWGFTMDNKKDIVSLFLADRSGHIVLLSGDTTGKNTTSAGFWAAIHSPEIFIFEALFADPVASTSLPAVRVSKSLSYAAKGENEEGVLTVTLNLRTVSDLADKTDLGEGGFILIVDDSDNLVFSTVSSSSASAIEALSLASLNHFGGMRARTDGRNLYVNINTLSQTRWRIITGYDITEVAKTRARTLLVTVLVVLFVFLLSAFAAGFISLRITRPLARLQRVMGKVENGDIGISVEPGSQREIAALSHAFNRMIEQIRTLMDRVVAEQRDKRKTELRALQNQINPHFLYNTLDSIVWLAENGRTHDVITTVVALAKFFRIGISRGDQFIPIRDELEHIRNYLTIQKIRYMDRFEYILDAEEGILDRKIMKLVLQPIVENAINHGIGDEPAHIMIRGFSDSKLRRTVFEIHNTGYGLTKARIDQIMQSLSSSEQSTGVGLKNTWQRLKVYYGEDAGIEIESIPDESTTVRLWIPEENTQERNNDDI